MELEDYDGATADFDRFLALNPDEPDGLLNRAIVRLKTKDFRGAVADLDRAEQVGAMRTRLYRLRELAKRALGDTAGADRDHETFLAKTPMDPFSWCARGELKFAQSPPDSEGALADFEEALKLDSDNLNALRDKASVLGENPRRYEEAIGVLNRVLELAPGELGDRAGRAVLLARIGKRAEALGEVKACLTARPANAIVLYQLASAMVLAGEKSRGMALLKAALREDSALALQMPTDPDLLSISDDVVFVNLIKAARTLSD
jgi:tetratricopeptide (TPR) repeat protein